MPIAEEDFLDLKTRLTEAEEKIHHLECDVAVLRDDIEKLALAMTKTNQAFHGLNEICRHHNGAIKEIIEKFQLKPGSKTGIII